MNRGEVFMYVLQRDGFSKYVLQCGRIFLRTSFPSTLSHRYVCGWRYSCSGKQYLRPYLNARWISEAFPEVISAVCWGLN